MPSYFDNIETSELIELLAYYTEKFTHLLLRYKGINPSREYLGCKQTLEIIFKEIQERGSKEKRDEPWWLNLSDARRINSIFEKQMKLIKEFDEIGDKGLVSKFKELYSEFQKIHERHGRRQATTEPEKPMLA